MRTKPPFRADHVGSLLRSQALKDARARREKNEITAAELKAIEDREIEALIKKQEAAGLQSVTDGEFRRASWQTDFLKALDGVESYVGERAFQFHGATSHPIQLRVNKKLGGYTPHPMIEHYKFVHVAHQGDAEDDDPVAVDAAFPLRPQGGAGDDLSVDGRLLPRPRPDLEQDRARLRRRRLPLSPARRDQSHLSLRSRAAPAGRRRAATIPTSCRSSMPA